MGRRRCFQVLKRLESNKEKVKRFTKGGSSFIARATKPSKASTIDLWVIKVLNKNTGLSAITTCSGKYIEKRFDEMSNMLLETKLESH